MTPIVVAHSVTSDFIAQSGWHDNEDGTADVGVGDEIVDPDDEDIW